MAVIVVFLLGSSHTVDTENREKRLQTILSYTSGSGPNTRVRT